MKLWMSGEVQVDVYPAFGIARNHMQKRINASLVRKKFGSGLIKLALIPIILGSIDPGFKEIKRYSKRTKVAEFRLRIPHELFKSRDHHGQEVLIFELLIKAVKALKSMKVPDFDLDRLEEAIFAIGQRHSWL